MQTFIPKTQSLLITIYLICFACVGIVTGQSYTWKKMPDMVQKSAALSASFMDGKIYVVGGSNGVMHNDQYGDNYLQIFDIEKNKWNLGRGMNYPRMMLSTAASDDKIYALGGGMDSYTSPKLEVYDPDSNAWTELAERPLPASIHGSVFFEDKIYTFGGSGKSDGTFPCYIYDIKTNSWTDMAEIPIPTGGFASLIFNGKIYVHGGVSKDGITLKALQVYDIQTNTWEIKTESDLARFGSVSAEHGGKIYVFGGATFPTNVAQKDIQIYDIATDSWSVDPDLKLPVATQWASIINIPGSNDLYIMGGEDRCMLTYSNAVILKTMYKLTINTTGNQETDIAGTLSIFPNPVQDLLHISLSDHSAGNQCKVSIFDLTGHQIYTGAYVVDKGSDHCIRVNTSQLRPGMYFCSIELDGQIKTINFIK
jgi:N-acetylneuraminic acid mutarotase